MSNVIRFPPSELAARHVLIEVGTISGPPDHPHLGARRYFVSVVDAHDDMLGVWEGSTHKDALYEARKWDLPIVDTIVNGRAGGAA